MSAGWKTWKKETWMTIKETTGRI